VSFLTSVLTAFFYPLAFVFTYSVCPFVYTYVRAYDLNDFSLYKIQATWRGESKCRNVLFRLLDKLVKDTFLIFNAITIIILLAFTTHLQVLASSVLRFRDHTQGHTTVGRTPLDEWSARRRDLYLTNTQHSQQTNIHVPGGIRTRNPSKRAAADPRLRPLGHWDRQFLTLAFTNLSTNQK
jgi:hypothetical protein